MHRTWFKLKVRLKRGISSEEINRKHRTFFTEFFFIEIFVSKPDKYLHCKSQYCQGKDEKIFYQHSRKIHVYSASTFFIGYFRGRLSHSFCKISLFRKLFRRLKLHVGIRKRGAREYRERINHPALGEPMSIQAGTESRSENDSEVLGNRPERR